MDVAILYSGGKDSNLALEFAIGKGWNVKYLLSVKPTRTDCYLFHYATVEHTEIQAEILGIPHVLVTCGVADPIKEAEIVRDVVKENPVDAVLLGGTGLQVTQIKSVQDALLPLGVEAFAAHAGMEHEELLREMVKRGYKIMISQFACEGLDEEWLGKVLDEKSVEELIDLSQEYGFHSGGDGSAFDTFVVDCPLFDKKINFFGLEKFSDGEFSGFVVGHEPQITEKPIRQSL